MKASKKLPKDGDRIRKVNIDGGEHGEYETYNSLKSHTKAQELLKKRSYVDYDMNKYRRQLNGNNNDHSKKWTPQYVVQLFNVTDYALKEAFLNIVQKCNTDKIVIADNSEDVNVFLDGFDDKAWVDVYDVLYYFNIVDPAYQHAVKKILAAGNRGGFKTKETDLFEIISALSRVK